MKTDYTPCNDKNCEYYDKLFECNCCYSEDNTKCIKDQNKMTPERKKELMEQAAVIIAKAEGNEVEREKGFSWEPMEDHAAFDFSMYRYRIKKVPTVKYIPFTAETFKEHRDRWIRTINGKAVLKIVGYSEKEFLVDRDYDGVGTKIGNFTYLMENFVFDDTGEPCGQKVTE